MGNECKRLTLSEACAFLKQRNRFCIITHAFPDGDTLGSGFGLCALLRKMGKEANVVLLRWQDDQTFPVCLTLMRFFRTQDFHGQTQKSSKQTGMVIYHLVWLVTILIWCCLH